MVVTGVIGLVAAILGGVRGTSVPSVPAPAVAAGLFALVSALFNAAGYPLAGAMLSDAARLPDAGPELFNPGHYGEQARPVDAGGRQAAWFVQGPGWQGVLRRKDAKMGQRSVERFLHRPKLELYHLADDPNELTNFAGNPRNEKLVAELRGRLLEWQKATADPWLVKERYE